MVEFALRFFSSPVRWFVLFTFIIALLKVNRKNKTDMLIMAVLTVCLTSEIMGKLFNTYKIPRAILTTVITIIHHGLWLLLLAGKLAKRSLLYWLTACFCVFGIINLGWLEGQNHFNYYTFVVGAFLYIAFFITESYRRLLREDVGFFLAIDYVLLFSPVVLFFGLSFMFGFKSQSVTSTFLLGIKLYDLIIIFVNVFYYAAINIYLFGKEK